MTTFQACASLPMATPEEKRPLMVVGITHSQTALVLRGRLQALRHAGFRVVLISSPGWFLNQIAMQEGVEALPIPMRRNISPVADIMTLTCLFLTLRRLKPVVTEFGTPKAGLLGSLAALLCGVPQRIYLVRGLRLETATGLRRWILKMAERVASACCHTVLCTSASVRQQLEDLHLSPPSRIRMLGMGSSCGVDLKRFRPGPTRLRTELGIPGEESIIGFVGRLTLDKGIPELLAAFEFVLQQAPNAFLLLVGWFDAGDDALPTQVRNTILQHPSVIYTGFVDDPAGYYRAMDILVLPTRREGFPNVVLEAAASGIPVITTSATGARDSVLPDVTGLLVAPGDSKSLGEAIIGLLRSPERRRNFGLAARRWVEKNFDQEVAQARNVAFYRAMLADSPAASALDPRDAVAAAD